jgi:histidinol phosphatase-like PHP family hydrolase
MMLHTFRRSLVAVRRVGYWFVLGSDAHLGVLLGFQVRPIGRWSEVGEETVIVQEGIEAEERVLQ